jgi:hypothetical protein
MNTSMPLHLPIHCIMRALLSTQAVENVYHSLAIHSTQFYRLKKLPEAHQPFLKLHNVQPLRNNYQLTLFPYVFSK